MISNLKAQEVSILPDWGKMRFTKYPSKPWKDILPGLQPTEQDLVSKLVVYESGDRLIAEEVCVCATICMSFH